MKLLIQVSQNLPQSISISTTRPIQQLLIYILCNITHTIETYLNKKLQNINFNTHTITTENAMEPLLENISN